MPYNTITIGNHTFTDSDNGFTFKCDPDGITNISIPDLAEAVDKLTKTPEVAPETTTKLDVRGNNIFVNCLDFPSGQSVCGQIVGFKKLYSFFIYSHFLRIQIRTETGA